MAQKATKPTKAEFIKKIDQTIGRGELRAAVEMVRDADLSESAFDKLMNERPNLREAYSAL